MEEEAAGAVDGTGGQLPNMKRDDMLSSLYIVTVLGPLGAFLTKSY